MCHLLWFFLFKSVQNTFVAIEGVWMCNSGGKSDFSFWSKKIVLPADSTLFRLNVHMTPLLFDLQYLRRRSNAFKVHECLK